MEEKYGKCECCGDELEEWESALLDCGHYACNDCTYDRFSLEGENYCECEKCRKNRKDNE